MAYAIIRVDNGSIYRRFVTLPDEFRIETRRIISPVAVGDEGTVGGVPYRFVDVNEVNFNRPGQFFHQGTDERDPQEGPVFVGTVLTITRNWTPWTQQEIDASIEQSRTGTVSELSDAEALTRAILLVIMDEFNLHATKLEQILQAGSTATSIANFRTAMGAIQAIPQRTATQLRNSVRAKLGASDA